IAFDACGAVLFAAGVAAILYFDGHGIHFAANSVANGGPGPGVDDLVHFWDERFSHVEAVLGWFGLVGCFCFAEARSRPAGGAPATPIAALTAVLLGWTFFTSTVEGATWPLMLAAAVGFAVWGWRSPRPILLTSTAAYLVGALLLAIWAIWQGGVPEFSDAGFL
ncbi:MAG: hypothetical protein ACR2OC_07730, partial [Solirubrobacterales bacterium]